jgi:hypothetical protein
MWTSTDTATSGDVTWTAGISAPVVIFSGTFSADRNLNLQAANVVGDPVVRVIRNTSADAQTLNVNNSASALLKAMPKTSWGSFIYDGETAFQWIEESFGSL